MTDQVGRKFCRHEKCKQSFVPHRWAPEINKGSKWFHQRNGDSWCPLHVPDWVETWRANKRRQ